jgi:steroid 5-alpha reductase family enzyme
MSRDEVRFTTLVVAASATLLVADGEFGRGLAVAIGLFTLVWVVSLALKDASIADIFWGPGIALIGWFYVLQARPFSWIGTLTVGLATVWALRLALYIAVRNAGRGEDYRYRKWREASGRNFWWVSFFKVFVLQGVLAWIVSSPLSVSQGAATSSFALALVCLGIGLWLLGFFYETVADWQLYRFKSDPVNKGRVLDRGLWALSRHPNYFGEAVLWWGIGLIAAASGGVLAFLGPAVLTFTLLRVSGVAMLDRELVHRRRGYERYISDTPAFFPIKIIKSR